MKLVNDMDFDQRSPTELFCDNTSVIAISKDSVFHDRTKYMKIKFYAIKQFQQERGLKLIYYTTKEQLANLFIKPLAKDRFEALRERIGMCSFGTKNECWNDDSKAKVYSAMFILLFISKCHLNP